MIRRRDFVKRAAAALGCGALLPVAGLAPAAAAPAGRRTMQQARLLMGTFVTLTAVTTDAALADEAFAGAFAEMERLIRIFDRHDSSSALGLLNRSGSLSQAPAELVGLLKTSARIARASGNAFNPNIAPVVDLFARSRAAGDMGPDHFDRLELGEALALAEPGGIRLGADSIRLERSGMRLTLDGIAKGRIADAASALLLRKGLADHMIDAGGDIRCSGKNADRPWSVGIRHPLKSDAVLCGVRLGDEGLATSGNYENYYDQERTRHHLVSHVSGRSPLVAGVSVRAENAMLADALATTLALLPPDKAVQYVKSENAACLIMDNQGRIWRSSNWS